MLLLQQLLNQDPATQLSVSGPGSPGNETSFFGPLTVDALKRFQQKYAQDILVPQGLSIPTGELGLFTRLKLNLLYPQEASLTSFVTNAPTIIEGVEFPANYTIFEGRLPSEEEIQIAFEISGGIVDSSSDIADLRLQLENSSFQFPLSSSSGTQTSPASSNITIPGSSGFGLPSFSLFPPFGGKILRFSLCTCTPAVAFTIFNASGGTKNLLYIPIISSIYKYYNLFIPGTNVLGTTTPIRYGCFQGLGIAGFGACVPDPTYPGTISIVRLVGTSLGPGF